MEKYSQFKKLFEGDPKLNITAIDKNGYVLGHMATSAEVIEDIEAVLKRLKSTLKEPDRVYKYEIIFPKIS